LCIKREHFEARSPYQFTASNLEVLACCIAVDPFNLLFISVADAVVDRGHGGRLSSLILVEPIFCSRIFLQASLDRVGHRVARRHGSLRA
jgi:hypothetical protein